MHASRVTTAAPVVRAAQVANQRSNIHRLTDRHGRLLEHMTVDRDNPFAVVELDTIAEATAPSSLDNASGPRGVDAGSGRVGDIQAIVEATIWRSAPSEWRRDLAASRPD